MFFITKNLEFICNLNVLFRLPTRRKISVLFRKEGKFCFDFIYFINCMWREIFVASTPNFPENSRTIFLGFSFMRLLAKLHYPLVHFLVFHGIHFPAFHFRPQTSRANHQLVRLLTERLPNVELNFWVFDVVLPIFKNFS